MIKKMIKRMTKNILRLVIIGLLISPILAKPPNILLLISDDQGWTDFGFMGHKIIKTPNLDRLSKESAWFPRGYVTTSLCRPSLATLITGLYPHQHKISGNDPPDKNNRDVMLKHIRKYTPLPKRLAEKGYLSLQVGKWWEGPYQEGGFTHGLTKGSRHGDDGLTIGREGLDPVYDFINEAGDKPWFIWYAPLMPHTPHRPPQRILKKYSGKTDSPYIDKYYAMCDWFDETCGDILKFLDKKKLTDDTLLLFITYNGWIQPKERRVSIPFPYGSISSKRGFPFMPRSKRSPNEGGIRTPVMIKWPGKVRPGERDKLVNSIDIAPTVLRAAGIEPENLPGVDLLAVSDDRIKRDTIFGELFLHDIVDIDDASKSLLYRWTIKNNMKLILPNTKNEPAELYDLKKDPHEKKNLAKKNKKKVKELTSVINNWWDGN